MTKVRLTKEFRFEMAHALWNYDGVCSNIHGHSYILYVTVIGEPCADTTSPKLGMVMDFGDLKSIVTREIVNKLDHSVVFNRDFCAHDKLDVSQMFERHLMVDYQPTCENMIIDFAERINRLLPDNITLYSLKLHETSTSFAEWYASDNM